MRCLPVWPRPLRRQPSRAIPVPASFLVRLPPIIALLTAAMFPVAALAGNAPSFDCTKAQTSVEERICSDTALSALDRRLSRRFEAALTTVGNLDAGQDEARQALRATQRGWIRGRDACWKADDTRECVELSYQRREAELVSQWMLEPPTGTTIWVCDGNPANELVTTFFDTEMPALRLEHGDDIAAMTQIRTASGAKYEGTFGRTLWIKGDEARYRAPDPDGTEVTCTIAEHR